MRVPPNGVTVGSFDKWGMPHLKEFSMSGVKATLEGAKDTDYVRAKWKKDGVVYLKPGHSRLSWKNSTYKQDSMVALDFLEHAIKGWFVSSETENNMHELFNILQKRKGEKSLTVGDIRAAVNELCPAEPRALEHAAMQMATE
jgi:hypothetical protein